MTKRINMSDSSKITSLTIITEYPDVSSVPFDDNKFDDVVRQNMKRINADTLIVKIHYTIMDRKAACKMTAKIGKNGQLKFSYRGKIKCVWIMSSQWRQKIQFLFHLFFPSTHECVEEYFREIVWKFGGLKIESPVGSKKKNIEI